MKINSNMPGNIAKLYQSNKPDQTQTEQAGIKSGVKAVESDSVHLSEQAQKISELIKETKDLPEIREEKINRIKAEIANNTYHVSAQQLAAKMIASENE